jgi:dihydrofolate synthase / folylpolyglutamate synthase
MDYSEAIAFLYDLRLFGTKLGLENTRELARLNGNAQEKLRFIHVAGTNGKGSTCAILESIYRAQGLKTALFTSPHLVSFTERIQVNRTCISVADVARVTAAVIESMGGCDTEQWAFRPTFFEFVTVMALRYFAEQKVDLVIWETGMGGRLDATNIVTPLVSVITNIQHDHQNWLGTSLEEIAAEKAGIIKADVPVITAATGLALEVIRSTAAARMAPLTIISSNGEFAEKFGPLLKELPLRGEHQRINALLALAVTSVLDSTISVTPEALRRGIRSVSWPGRLQVVKYGPTEFLLDGAHNPDGAKTLGAALQKDFKGRSPSLVLGLFRDKAWQEMCESLVPLSKRVLLVPVANERSADPAEVQSFCKEKWPEIEAERCENLSTALRSCASESFVVIAGSLHLIGEAMELLHVLPSRLSERSLNEWDAANSAANRPR